MGFIGSLHLMEIIKRILIYIYFRNTTKKTQLISKSLQLIKLTDILCVILSSLAIGQLRNRCRCRSCSYCVIMRQIADVKIYARLLRPITEMRIKSQIFPAFMHISVTFAAAENIHPKKITVLEKNQKNVKNPLTFPLLCDIIINVNLIPILNPVNKSK